MKKSYQQKLKHKFSRIYFIFINLNFIYSSNLFNMKNEYEQSSIEERQLWREKLRNRFMNNNSSNQQLENNIIEKSVKFIR
jgi:diacylglycerol kinase family enzyme